MAYVTLNFFCNSFLYKDHSGEMVDTMTMMADGTSSYYVSMQADYSKGRNYEQPMLIELIESSIERSQPVLLNNDGDYNMENRKLITNKINKINCVKLSVPTEYPI